MVFAHNEKKIVLPALLATVTLFSACSRMQVVPEEEQGSPVHQPPAAEVPNTLPPGTVIVPPVITQPAEMPGTTADNNTHVVQAGEGLYGIARTYGLNFKDLAAWNHVAPPYTAISPGQVLVLSPVAGAPSPIAPPIAPVAPPTYVPPSAPNAPAPVVIGSTYHTVSAGETLYSIARSYGLHFRDVASWNNIGAPYSLSVGQKILISRNNVTPAPAPQPVAPAPVPSASTQYHTVQRGETLYGVARSYNRNFRDLAAWNNVMPPYSLSVGQRLRVSPATTKTSNSMRVNSNNNSAFHNVRRGDTLYNIAMRYGQTVGDITLWNNLQPPYTLFIGQRLRISPNAGMQTRAPAPSPSANPFGFASKGIQSAKPNRSTTNSSRIYHQVRAGESLANIAALYGQGLRELALWNGIAPPYPVYQGQTILVHPR